MLCVEWVPGDILLPFFPLCAPIEITIRVIPAVLPMLLHLTWDRSSLFFLCSSEFSKCIVNIICTLKLRLQMSSLAQPYIIYMPHWCWVFRSLMLIMVVVIVQTSWKWMTFICFLTHAVQYSDLWKYPQFQAECWWVIASYYLLCISYTTISIQFLCAQAQAWPKIVLDIINFCTEWISKFHICHYAKKIMYQNT